MTAITIRPARPDDAADIARAVLMAVGDDITLSFAGSPQRLPLVFDLFAAVASRDDSQYSYRNALVAMAPDGRTAGIIVSYDGAKLHRLREAFIEEANARLDAGLVASEMADETDGGEIYLDTLAVFPEFRGQGLASRLIADAIESHKDARKPVGLLVDPDNPGARRLYDRLGFKPVGMRPFAGVSMVHMQR